MSRLQGSATFRTQSCGFSLEAGDSSCLRNQHRTWGQAVALGDCHWLVASGQPAGHMPALHPR